MQVTLICTVLNEAETLQSFLDSVIRLNRAPDEFVICDGGSTDSTIEILQDFADQSPYPVKIIERAGNISTGRNTAIQNAMHDIIASTDAGCRLHPDWLHYLMRPFEENATVDVVSGWYEAAGETWFEQCAGVITLSTKGIRPKDFLPSGRSVAFRKLAWVKAGKFPENLDYAEDTYFALSLKQVGCHFVLAPEAKVFWRPRSSLRRIYKQFANYSRGDAHAGIRQGKHLRLYCRYIIWISLIILTILYPSLWWLLVVGMLPYWLVWVVLGWKDCRDWRALWLTPIIKLVVDVANMVGYIEHKLSKRHQSVTHYRGAL